MIARLGRRLALPLVAVSALACCTLAQTLDDASVRLVRASLGQRGLWGPDYNLLIASIPAWARIQEKTIVIANEVIIGGTPYRDREEAEKQAKALAAALGQAPPSLAPAFAPAAPDARAAAAKVAVRRYGGDGSYRVVIGPGLSLLPSELSVVELRRALGNEESVKREVEDVGGERRPTVYSGHVYAGGAVTYQTSNYAPTPDQVARVVLGIPSALRAIAEAR